MRQAGRGQLVGTITSRVKMGVCKLRMYIWLYKLHSNFLIYFMETD